jgi:RNA polymerase sigma factor (sigma-70 family)
MALVNTDGVVAEADAPLRSCQMATSAVPVGDMDDFAAFFDAEFARTARSVNHIVGNAAQDVAQEAFLVALQKWPSVAKLEAPDGWVRLVARRIAWRRRGREQSRWDRESAATWAAGSRSENMLDMDLQRALSILPHRQRAAIILHYVAGLSVRQAAEVIHAREPAVKVSLFRGRRQLADALTGHRGRWVSERKWRADDVAVRLRQTGDDAHIDTVVDSVFARNVRWTFRLEHGVYIVETDDGERLDHGHYRSRPGRIVLTPWDHSGTVVLAASVDGSRAHFRVVEDTTAPTRGVPDEVYLRLLLGSDSFVWTPPAPKSSNGHP